MKMTKSFLTCQEYSKSLWYSIHRNLRISLFYSFLFLCISANAQTLVFQETFNETVGSTSGISDEGNAVSWSATCPACLVGDFFEIVNGGMEGEDTNGPAEWLTGNITIPMNTAVVTFSFDYNHLGYLGSDNLECNAECGSCPCDPMQVVTNGACNNCWDYLLYNMTTGGSSIAADILIGCDCNDMNNSLCQVLDVAALTSAGDIDIQLEIEMAMWATGEFMNFDNITIITYTAAEALTAGVGMSCTPPVCDLMTGTITQSCMANTAGTDIVDIILPFTDAPANSMVSVTGGSLTSSATISGSGNITLTANEGTSITIDITPSTFGCPVVSVSTTTIDCLPTCEVSGASVVATCTANGLYDLDVTFTHSAPLVTPEVNIVLSGGVSATMNNVATTGGSQTVMFSGLVTDNNSTPVMVNISDVTPPSLVAGDILFVGYHADNPSGSADKSFCFIATTDIVGGQIIRFTDRGWQTSPTAQFRSGEGNSDYTVPTAGLSCGDIVCLDGHVGNFNLSTGGDQVLAYTGTDANPTFIAAIHADAAWEANATNANTSALPPGLTDNVNAISFAQERDNYMYDPSTAFNGTIASLETSLGVDGNWTASNSTISGAHLPANYDITLTDCPATSGGCSAMVTFNEPDCSGCFEEPIALPEGPYTACEGMTITLGDATTGGSATCGSWSITSASGGATIGDGTLSSLTCGDPSLVTFTGAASGTYTLTLTTDNPDAADGCTVDAQMTDVVVTALELGTFSYPQATFCTNDADPTPTVSGGTVDAYFRSDDVLDIVFNMTTGVIDVSASTPGGPYTIEYRTSNSACADVVTFDVTIAIPPTVGMTTNPACTGSNATFTATPTGQTNYEFFDDTNLSGTVDVGESLQSGSSNTYTSSSLANNDIISVLVTNSDGCSAVATAMANILAGPVFTPSVTQPSCSATGLISVPELTTPPGATYTYEYSNGGAFMAMTPNGANQEVTINQGGQSASVYTIRVTRTDMTPMCMTDEMVNINAVSGCCTMSDAGVADIVCNNANTSMTTSDDTYSFTISPSGSGLGAMFTISGLATTTGNGNGIYSYASAPITLGPFLISSGNQTFTITDNNTSGCLLMDVVVTAPPTCSSCPTTTANLTGSTAHCGKASSYETTLTFTTSGGVGPFTVTYSDGTSNTVLSAIPSGGTFTVTPTVSTTYTLVSVVNEGVPDVGCMSDVSGSVGVEVTILNSNCGSFPYRGE